MRCCAGVVLGLAMGLSLVKPASAQQVEWRAPDGCPSTAEVRRRVEAALGEHAPDFDWSAAGAVERRAPALWTLELRLRTTVGDSHRELEAASCEELARAAVAIISLALADSPRAEAVPVESEVADIEPDDPPAIDRPPLRPRPAGSEASLPVHTEDEMTEFDVGPDAAATRIHWLATTGLGVDEGSQPVSTGVVRVGLARVWRRYQWHWRLGYAGNVFEQEEVIAEPGAVEPVLTNSELWTLSTALCRAPIERLVRAGACLGAETGVYATRAEGPESSQSAGEPWLAASAGLVVGYGRGWIRPSLLAEGALPIVTPAHDPRGRSDAALRLVASAEFPF